MPLTGKRNMTGIRNRGINGGISAAVKHSAPGCVVITDTEHYTEGSDNFKWRIR